MSVLRASIAPVNPLRFTGGLIAALADESYRLFVNGDYAQHPQQGSISEMEMLRQLTIASEQLVRRLVIKKERQLLRVAAHGVSQSFQLQRP